MRARGPPDGDRVLDLVQFGKGTVQPFVGAQNVIEFVLGHAVGQQGKFQRVLWLTFQGPWAGEGFSVPEIGPAFHFAPLGGLVQTLHQNGGIGRGHDAEFLFRGVRQGALGVQQRIVDRGKEPVLHAGGIGAGGYFHGIIQHVACLQHCLDFQHDVAFGRDELGAPAGRFGEGRQKDLFGGVFDGAARSGDGQHVVLRQRRSCQQSQCDRRGGHKL